MPTVHLLDYVAGHSDGFRIDRAVGVESEMELPPRYYNLATKKRASIDKC